MSNRQVIALFVLGVALLLGAFWAGRAIINQGTSANASAATAAPAQSPQAVRSVKDVPQAAEQPSAEARYIVEIRSSYGTAKEADEFMMKLRAKYPSARTQRSSEDSLYRIQIGPYNTREDAQQVATELSRQGLRGVMITPWKQG